MTLFTQKKSTGRNIPFLASLSNSFGPVEPKLNENDAPATPAPIYRFVPEVEITDYQVPAPVAIVPAVQTIAQAVPAVSVVEPAAISA